MIFELARHLLSLLLYKSGRRTFDNFSNVFSVNLKPKITFEIRIITTFVFKFAKEKRKMFKNQHNNIIEDPEVFELAEQVDKRIDRIQQLLDMKRSEASKRFRLFLANLIDNYLDIRNNNNDGQKENKESD